MKTKSLIILCSLLIFSRTLSASNYYATTTGTGNGTSWSQATTLAGALALATSDDDVINLGAGTYVPTVLFTGGTVTRDKTFEVNKNISLIGGYPAAPVDGDVTNDANLTILDGQLDVTNNTYHVLVLCATKAVGKKITLDGLTIKNAYSNGTGSITGNGNVVRMQGGGIFGYTCDVNINNCKIIENKATINGGVYIKDGAVNISNSTISNNEATTGASGGLYLLRCIGTLSNSVISFNKSTVSSSGGISLYTTTLDIIQCQISNNYAKINGAGINMSTNCNVTLTQCLISNNEAGGVAAGIHIQSGVLKIYSSTVANNKASTTTTTAACGGLYVRDDADVLVLNSTFYDNQSAGNGGGICMNDGTPTTPNTKLTVVSSTITNNTAVDGTRTGGIYVDNACIANIYNSIVSGNVGEITNLGKHTSGTLNTKQVISGSDLIASDGTTVSNSNFIFSTMLGTLANNGGNTSTCALLLPASNPAVVNGLGQTDFINMVSSLSIVESTLMKDQRVQTRYGGAPIAIGACSSEPNVATTVVATAGNAQASVAFTAPACNGGSAIIDYTVTSNPGGFTKTGASSPIVVSGLTNDIAYTFTVTARNVIGSSLASAVSNEIIPSVIGTLLNKNNTTSVKLIVGNGNLLVDNLSQGLLVSVYSLQGMLIAEKIAQSQSLKFNLTHGIYLVKVNNTPYKVSL